LPRVHRRRRRGARLAHVALSRPAQPVCGNDADAQRDGTRHRRRLAGVAARVEKRARERRDDYHRAGSSRPQSESRPRDRRRRVRGACAAADTAAAAPAPGARALLHRGAVGRFCSARCGLSRTILAASDTGGDGRCGELRRSRNRKPSPERGSIMSKSRVLGEFFQFLKQEKKYWLVPIVIVFVLFGLLLVFSQSSAVAPFIYTLF